MTTTDQLANVIQLATRQTDWRLHPSPGRWQTHPAARTFQALRILVNRELGNLGNLLRILPNCLQSGGKAVMISFHSGEDRLVKGAFSDGRHRGDYDSVAEDVIRSYFTERDDNPRARSAKLRWARRGGRNVVGNSHESSTFLEGN